ncbi:MAG TPA: GDP-mannose 4,6-dehydratase [candidate division Zixibacteria bacterium]|nr:GDP-mannose 4,6-dehydratase [candidate division Zixibacteria bacterium]
MTARAKRTDTVRALSGARALVTGAGGFIGSHLVERLCELGAEVTALFRYTSQGSVGALAGSEALREVKLQFGDIRDPDCCARAVKNQDFVFHLAAQIAIPYSYLSPRDFVETNVVGTVNLLQAARDNQRLRRFLLMSTSEVYGSAQYTPIDEAHPLRPQSPYAASKVAAEALVNSFAASFELPLTVVRAFNTYGPRQSARAVIPTIILQALAGTRLRLGATNTRRDFLFVSDTTLGVAQAAAAAKTVGATINLCSGVDSTIAEIVAKTGRALDRKLAVVLDKQRVRPKRSEVARLLGDGSLAQTLCGFTPRTTLEDGLAETIAWWRECGERGEGRDAGVYRI